MRPAELRNALASLNYLDPTGTKPTPRTPLLELKLAPDYCTQGLGRSGSGAEPIAEATAAPSLAWEIFVGRRFALQLQPCRQPTHRPQSKLRAMFVRRGSSPTHGRALCLRWLSPPPPQPPQVRKTFMLWCRNPFMRK